MDKYDLEIEEKNIIGAIDRLLINFGMAFIAIIPTYSYLIFKPKAMCYMLRGEEADGRQGLKLGPGITFIFTLLMMMGVAYISRDVIGTSTIAEDTESARSGLRSAVSEGNIWRTILLSLPIYFMALYFGVMFHIIHRIFKHKSNLTLSVGIGFYILSTLLVLIVTSFRLLDHITVENASGVAIAGIVIIIGFLIIIPWQSYNFSRYAFDNTKGNAAVMACVTGILTLFSFALFGILVSALN